MKNTYDIILNEGGKWSGVIGRGQQIRFQALDKGANVSLLMYQADNVTERYNMPDTLKAQHTSHLTKGHIMLSDQGRVLASIIEDSVGWHDTLGGYSTRSFTDQQYGLTSYEHQQNEWLRSGQENLVIELMRNGLSVRDLVPVVNLFSKVACAADGKMNFSKDHCPKKGTVTLRTEMNTLFILSNTPHPLDPAAIYPSVPVEMKVSPAAPVDTQDECVNLCLENHRAFENTWDYYSLLGESGAVFQKGINKRGITS